MWPFKNDSKETVRQFSNFVPPDVLEEILNRPEAGFSAPQQRLIDYNIVQVRDDDVGLLNDRITEIVDVVLQNGGIIVVQMVSLLMILFGAAVSSESDPAVASGLVAMQLVEMFRDEVKVVYGNGEAAIGTCGHPQYASFGSAFPLFSQRLQVLCTMDYGSLREMNL